MVKIKKSFFDKLDDSSVKYAFGLAYFVGAFVIILGPNFPGKYTSTFVLIAIMMAYLFGIIFLNKKMNTEDKINSLIKEKEMLDKTINLIKNLKKF